MKYALNLAGGRSSHAPSLLEEGQTRSSVAADCRTAALDFMAGVAEGWTKFDLALWLHGQYALASRHAQAGDRIPAGGRPIAATTIENLLVQTRSHVLASLERAALSNGRLDFIEQALVDQHVVRARSDEGEPLWVPVDAARMRLRERVQALFVADYLNRPGDYHHLYVCHHCERIVFEPGARERGMCANHPRNSGFIVKSGPRTTLAYGE